MESIKNYLGNKNIAITADRDWNDHNLNYMFDTEIINGKKNIRYFRDKYFSDYSEKRFGTDYIVFGNLGIVPIGNYFNLLGFGFDYEFGSSLDDINKIRNSSYIVVIVGGQIIALESPLKWFSWIVDKPIADFCNVKLPQGTAFNIELRFDKELSRDTKFALIVKYERYCPIR